MVKSVTSNSGGGPSAVLVVLIGYVIALPGVISFYLWFNRKELYSTTIFQTIGWLYDPFVRGAEFWQVHDVMMKMILRPLWTVLASAVMIAMWYVKITPQQKTYVRPK